MPTPLHRNTTTSLQTVRLDPAVWGLIVCSAIFYVLISAGFEGPTYLHDEVGYLAKAALLAGKPVDAASSYHAGYSILLSPLFWLSSDVQKIWAGVILLNTGLWVASLAMTHKLILIISPCTRPLGVLAGVAGVASYPAWSSLTGYALSSPLLVAAFLLNLLFLSNLVHRKWQSPAALAICSGFTFWIHPTGLAVIAALALTLLITAPQPVRSKLLGQFLFVVGMVVLLYKGLVHPWINQAMTPDGFEATTHYKSYASVIIRLTDPEVIGRSFLRLIGEFSYLVISTLGIFVLGTWKMIRSTHGNRSSAAGASSLFCILAMTGVAVMAALQLETFETANQIHHWQYGRYIDTVLPPILAIGFTQIFEKSRARQILIGAITVLIFLVASGWALDQWAHADPSSNNIITTPGFWPQYIHSKSDYLNWYILGAAGCCIALSYPKYTMLPAWACVVSISISAQLNWHKKTYIEYSKSTDLPNIIKANYNNGTCIGIDRDVQQKLSINQNEKLNSYSIHLTNMRYNRMRPEQWLKECNGPYLTYFPKAFKSSSQTIPYLKELDSGLYLIERVQRFESSPYLLPEDPKGLMIGMLSDRDLLLRTIFNRNPNDLVRHTQVGLVEKDGLHTTGKQGYLFYGPYVTVPRGNYRLEISVTTTDTKNLTLDVVSNHANKIHWQNAICSTGCAKKAPVIGHFAIEQDTEMLEIRMAVLETSTAVVHSVKMVATDSSTLANQQN